jgi:hypothetical protein
LQNIIQGGTVEEGAGGYALSSLPSSNTDPRYRFEKRGKESWAVLDSHQGEALLALVKYKKGAEALIERLEAYERYIASLAAVHAKPHQTTTDGRPALQAPP